MLSIYEGIPHLLAPVVTDMRQAGHALNWAVAEMEKRYRLMSHLGVRNLAGYNSRIIEAEKKEEKIPNPFSITPDSPEPLEKMPQNRYHHRRIRRADDGRRQESGRTDRTHRPEAGLPASI